MIDARRVNEIFEDCLFKDEETLDNNEFTSKPILIKGITMYVGFNSERLNENKDEINDLINKLHPNFKKGWSFSNMCLTDNDNNIWTGSHRTMEELLILGLAIKKIEYCCDRDMWSIFPDGMPYIRVICEEKTNDVE